MKKTILIFVAVIALTACSYSAQQSETTSDSVLVADTSAVETTEELVSQVADVTSEIDSLEAELSKLTNE